MSFRCRFGIIGSLEALTRCLKINFKQIFKYLFKIYFFVRIMCVHL
jgi:hypothetical protein